MGTKLSTERAGIGGFDDELATGEFVCGEQIALGNGDCVGAVGVDSVGAELDSLL